MIQYTGKKSFDNGFTERVSVKFKIDFNQYPAPAGASHAPHGAKEKKMRFVFAIVCWVLLLLGCIILGQALGYPILGGALGFLAVSLSTGVFLVSVPEVTGLLTVNALTGVLHPYGTGLHFRFPWEQVKEGNFINLRVVTENMEESYPAQDGPVMLVKWSFQYRPSAEAIYDHTGKSPLERYISADDNTIKQGLKDVGSSILSANIAGFPADHCKGGQQVIEAELRSEFGTMRPTPEELYGIKLIRVSLADVDYEPTVQAVRASEQVAAKLRQIATAIRIDHPEISQKDAMNAAMIIHGKIKKDVVEVEGQGGEALAALLIAMSRGGGGR